MRDGLLATNGKVGDKLNRISNGYTDKVETECLADYSITEADHSL